MQHYGSTYYVAPDLKKYVPVELTALKAVLEKWGSSLDDYAVMYEHGCYDEFEIATQEIDDILCMTKEDLLRNVNQRYSCKGTKDYYEAKLAGTYSKGDTVPDPESEAQLAWDKLAAAFKRELGVSLSLTSVGPEDTSDEPEGALFYIPNEDLYVKSKAHLSLTKRGITVMSAHIISYG